MECEIPHEGNADQCASAALTGIRNQFESYKSKIQAPPVQREIKILNHPIY